MHARTRPFLATLVLAAFAGALLLARAYPLVDPDEGRNAEVAREMAVGGDLVVPHLAQMPYLDKPPALFWAAALAIRTFGAKPWAARLPAGVAAAATLWLIGALALDVADRRRAAIAIALLATAPLFAVLSAYVIFDMPLALCVTMVWTGIARELEAGPSTRRRAAMFAAVTLGVLLKGPVMLAWAVGGSAAAALLVRAWAPLAWLAWWPGWVMVFGVAGGWFAAASARHPEYPRYAFVEESLERVTSDSFHRQQPAWFVPAVLAAGALPWSLGTPWGRGLGRPSRVALGFALFAAVFFTASHSKLVTYLLPVIPALAWIAAEAWTARDREARGGWAIAAVLAVLAVAAVIADARHIQGSPFSPGTLPALAVVLLVIAAVAVAGVRTRSAGLVVAACALFMPALLVVAGRDLVRYARSQSGSELARAIADAGAAGATRFESCYNPGTNFLLGIDPVIVSPLGYEITSVYQVRYRETLQRRGQWKLLDEPPRHDDAVMVVRPPRLARAAPAGWSEVFRDAHFVAYHRDTTGH